MEDKFVALVGTSMEVLVAPYWCLAMVLALWLRGNHEALSTNNPLELLLADGKILLDGYDTGILNADCSDMR